MRPCSVVLIYYTNEAESNLLWITFALFKQYDVIQISVFWQEHAMKNMERMSLWMDEYRSVPISGWPNRKDCPSDDGPAKVSKSIKPSTFENSPIHNAVLPTLKI